MGTAGARSTGLCPVAAMTIAAGPQGSNGPLLLFPRPRRRPATAPPPPTALPPPRRRLPLLSARARYLLEGAKFVAGQLGGTFPTSAQELLKIPGTAVAGRGRSGSFLAFPCRYQRRQDAGHDKSHPSGEYRHVACGGRWGNRGSAPEGQARRGGRPTCS